MRNKYFETSVGIFIVIGVLCLLFLVFKVSNSSLKSFSSDEFSMQAQFKDIGSLRTNASVKIAGVEIGRVTKIALDKTYNGFMAVITMSINDKEIPSNYSASIQMSGILGDNYVALSPSKENIMSIAGLTDNSENKDPYFHQGSVIPLENTESAINLSSLINTFVAKDDSK